MFFSYVSAPSYHWLSLLNLAPSPSSNKVGLGAPSHQLRGRWAVVLVASKVTPAPAAPRPYPTLQPPSLKRTGSFPSRISGSGVRLLRQSCWHPRVRGQKMLVHSDPTHKLNHATNPPFIVSPLPSTHNEPSMSLFRRTARNAAGKISYEGTGAMDCRRPSLRGQRGWGANDLLTFPPHLVRPPARTVGANLHTFIGTTHQRVCN